MSDENVEMCAGVLLSAIRDLMSESRGVVGLHKNGDVAPWDEIDVEGRYSEWLGDAMGALHDALAHARASRPREAKCPACGGVGEHVEGKRGFTRFPCPNAAPPVAPEACPRCHGRVRNRPGNVSAEGTRVQLCVDPWHATPAPSAPKTTPLQEGWL